MIMIIDFPQFPCFLASRDGLPCLPSGRIQGAAGLKDLGEMGVGRSHDADHVVNP